MITVSTPDIGGPAPALPAELTTLLHRMRLPHMRAAAPDVLATAKAQRWDPAASSIPVTTQQALRTLEWIGRRENLVVCGPSGTGKTFLLEALGQQAVGVGLHVAWLRLEDLGALLR